MIGSRLPYPLRLRMLAMLAGICTITPIAAQRTAAQSGAVPRIAEWTGRYDGRAPEVAAGLELRANGRFTYGLSYGALDERAEGRWRIDAGRLLLTSDPVTAPRFVAVDRRPAPPGRLLVRLALPAGLSPQYFHAELRRGDGTVDDRQLDTVATAFDLDPADRAATITLTLPVMDLSSPPMAVPDPAARDLGFRFDPNDLGKVAFAATPLAIDRGDLLLVRHDRQVRFRRVRPG